jgi:hypothetical protein
MRLTAGHRVAFHRKLKMLLALLAGIAGSTVVQAETPAALRDALLSRWSNADPEDRAQRPL